MPGRIAAAAGGGGGAAAAGTCAPRHRRLHRRSTSTSSFSPASPAGMLSFLARLSGRRRHVRSGGCQQQQQQQSGSSRSCAAGGPGAASAGGSTAAAAGSPTAAMEQQQQQQQQQSDEEQLYHCCRCRGSRACSCSLLGLDDHERIQDAAQCNSTTTTTSSYASLTRLHRHEQQDNKYGSPRKLDCGCADRDVLRRRPPEKSGNSSSGSSSSRTSSLASSVRSSLGLVLPRYLATLLILSYSLIGMADACSSRSTPKPRPPTPTPRPNITFHMYTCPPDYAEWYCLNGATCFTVKIVDSLLYNCLCANGYIGQRCEFKDLDGSYLPSRQRVMLETASIAGAVTIAVFLAVITFISIYIHCKRKQKELRTSSGVDAVDGPSRDPERRPFCSHSRALMSFMAKNPNSSTAPSIEQTRMPTPWSPLAETSTRMASINENNRPTSQ